MALKISSSKPEKRRDLVSVSEAYNLWDLLASKYRAHVSVQTWENFAHDLDLQKILGLYIKDLQSEIKQLENMMAKFEIKAPPSQVADIKSTTNAEVLRDEFIASDFLLLLQGNIENLFKAFRTSVTNEEVRKLLMKFIENGVSRMDSMVSYNRLKGWIMVPLLYPLVPKNVTERLDTGEAFHLWDHLTFRYDNMEQTEIFSAFASDPDFKVLLKTGLHGTLKKQAEMLETELQHFGIPMPSRPPSTWPKAENSELLSDKFMYRALIAGMQGAAMLHAIAVKQCTTNDRIRGIFKQLLIEEISMIDKMVMYGKVKGWLNPAPQYGSVT